METIIKINRSNDWPIHNIALAFGGCIIFIVTIAVGSYWMSLSTAICIAALLTYGIQYQVNLANKQITVRYLVFGLGLPGNEETNHAKHYHTVQLLLRSEFAGNQFRTHSTRFHIREFMVELKSNEGGFKFPPFSSCQAARDFAVRLAKSWELNLDDNLREQMIKNKRKPRK